MAEKRSEGREDMKQTHHPGPLENRLEKLESRGQDRQPENSHVREPFCMHEGAKRRGSLVAKMWRGGAGLPLRPRGREDHPPPLQGIDPDPPPPPHPLPPP